MAPHDGEEASDDSGESMEECTAEETVPGPSEPGPEPQTAPQQQPKKTISCTQCRRRKLKCDRVKPSCGTCSRLRHQCIFPEGRMKSTVKRRNVKDLEARLAQVESLLNSEVAAKALHGTSIPQASAASAPLGPVPLWNGVGMDPEQTMGTGNLMSAIPDMAPPLFNEGPFSYDLIGYGLEEQLPPQQFTDQLNQIFFERVWPMMPVLHKYRYLATANLPPTIGPPVCLRYVVWAMAASAEPAYSMHGEVFYRRARKYAEADEMKGQGESSLTLAHAQTWALLSNYEAENMYMSRAWLSVGRCVRMVQIMNLHKLDSDATEFSKQILPPPRDWMEVEERRRTFWTAFCCDRYSCVGSGWPMSIDDRDIHTNLPCSDEAYERGEMEPAPSLAEAMTAQGAARISSFGGQAVMANLFGNNWTHLHRIGPDDHPQDPMKGRFWRRHRVMDEQLTNLSMFLPPQLRLPANAHDGKVILLHMNLHTSAICLHQAAIMKAEKHGLDRRIIDRSQARCRAAAEGIVNVIRMVSQEQAPPLNTWLSFNLYVAAGVLIEGCQTPETAEQSRLHLDFLLTKLSSLNTKRTVSITFITQLKLDLQAAGIQTWLGQATDAEIAQVGKIGGAKRTSIYSPMSERTLNNNLPGATIFPRRMARSGSNTPVTSSHDSASPPMELQNKQDNTLYMNGMPTHGQKFDLRQRNNQHAAMNMGYKPYTPKDNTSKDQTTTVTPLVDLSCATPATSNETIQYTQMSTFNNTSTAANLQTLSAQGFDMGAFDTAGYANVQFPMPQDTNLDDLLWDASQSTYHFSR